MAFDWPNPDYHETPLDWGGGLLRLRVFLDRSVIEVFAQYGVCLFAEDGVAHAETGAMKDKTG